MKDEKAGVPVPQLTAGLELELFVFLRSRARVLRLRLALLLLQGRQKKNISGNTGKNTLIIYKDDTQNTLVSQETFKLALLEKLFYCTPFSAEINMILEFLFFILW